MEKTMVTIKKKSFYKNLFNTLDTYYKKTKIQPQGTPLQNNFPKNIKDPLPALTGVSTKVRLWSWEKEPTELAFLVFPKLLHFFRKCCKD